MKNMSLQNGLCCTFTLVLYCLIGPLFAEPPLSDTDSNSKPDLSFDLSLCSKETLMTFFPQPVVKAVLKRNHVDPERAEAIAKELARKDREVVLQVESRASKMDPNPFKDLNQRDAAVKVFRETLYDIFAEVLKAHGIQDEAQIRTMLEDIQAVKGKLFVECIRREHISQE